METWTIGGAFVPPIVRAWMPALEEVERRLRRGARVAEVGVADASRAVVLALAYPASTFHGFDADPDRVAALRTAIARAGVSDRVTYELLTRRAVPGGSYDVISTARASRGIAPRRSMLRAGGVWIKAGPDASTVTRRQGLVPPW